jgi:hypothetical protein
MCSVIYSSRLRNLRKPWPWTSKGISFGLLTTLTWLTPLSALACLNSRDKPSQCPIRIRTAANFGPGRSPSSVGCHRPSRDDAVTAVRGTWEWRSRPIHDPRFFRPGTARLSTKALSWADYHKCSFNLEYWNFFQSSIAISRTTVMWCDVLWPVHSQLNWHGLRA